MADQGKVRHLLIDRELIRPITVADAVIETDEKKFMTKDVESMMSYFLAMYPDTYGVTGNNTSDTKATRGTALFNVSTTTNLINIFKFKTTALNYLQFNSMIRIKSSVIGQTEDILKITVYKNIGDVLTEISSRTLKGTDFEVSDNYEQFYLGFEYGYPRAKNNELTFSLDLLPQSVANTVYVDMLMISPMGIGVYTP